MSFAGTMQKRRKCKYIFFRLEMHKTLQLPVFLNAKEKNNIVNYSMFGGLIAKKCSYLHSFWNVKKTWKARTTVNSCVLTTFWHAGIYAVCCPWRYQTFVNCSIVCTCWALFWHWWTQKMLVLTHFPKNRRSWREPNPVNNSVLSCFINFRGLKLWYLRGFLPSDSTKCCKLRHFVRFLCSIFKTSDAFTCSWHSSTRNDVTDWS